MWTPSYAHNSYKFIFRFVSLQYNIYFFSFLASTLLFSSSIRNTLHAPKRVWVFLFWMLVCLFVFFFCHSFVESFGDGTVAIWPFWLNVLFLTLLLHLQSETFQLETIVRLVFFFRLLDNHHFFLGCIRNWLKLKCFENKLKISIDSTNRNKFTGIAVIESDEVWN